MSGRARGGLWWGALGGLLVASGLATGDRPALSGSVPSTAARSEAAPSTPAAAEVTLPRPTLHAVLQDDRDRVRLLLTPQEILVDSQQPGQAYTVVRIESSSVLLRRHTTGETFTWRRGRRVPGLPHLRLLDIVPVTTLRYEFEVVERVTHREPMLIAHAGSRVTVRQQTVRAARPATRSPDREPAGMPAGTSARVNPTMSHLLDVRALDADTYELPSPGLKPALANVGQALHDLNVMVSPTLSTQHGIGFSVSSDLADGTLTPGGFTVTNSKVAQLFGIEVGDTILSVNNRPVDSPLSAWWAYQEVVARQRPSSEFRVAIERGGSVLTKTYLVP